MHTVNTAPAQSNLRFHFDMELTCDNHAVILDYAKLVHSSGVSTKGPGKRRYRPFGYWNEHVRFRDFSGPWIVAGFG
jgi:hypothetical protein